MIASAQFPMRLPPPPRQVRRRPGWLGTNNNGCLIVFIVPFVLVGIGMLVAVPLRWWIVSHGKPVMVTIDGQTYSRSSSNNRSTYQVQFHYLYKGQTYHDQQQVTGAEYLHARKGRQVPGRVLQLGNWTLCISNVGDPNTNTEMIAIVAVILIGFMVLFTVFNFGPSIRQRRLVRDGTPAAGTIEGRNKIKGKSIRYSIIFNFKTSDGTEITNSAGISAKGYEAVTVGQSVTVLYDVTKPKRSVVYEYCDFEVVPMVG